MSARPDAPRPPRGSGKAGPACLGTQELSLAACVATFRDWLHLPDPGALLVTLAAVAVNRVDGDPVWLQLVGPPGSGKTELLTPLAHLPDVYPTATLTEAALLSGVPKKDHAADAKGGLLREIGNHGIIVLKDFGSVLSMNRDTRAAVLAALREVYDGSWTRRVGTDGGRTLSWSGKVGLIAGCPPAIDTHHAVIASMGERFIFYRLPATDGDQQARRALGHVGRESAMRKALCDAVRLVLENINIDQLLRRPDGATSERLVTLAAVAACCRSAVERDPATREISLIPEPEAPGRLALVLLRLLNALRAIGADEGTAWGIVTKCALDSMPAIRRTVLTDLMANDASTANDVAARAGYPLTTTRRALEELAVYGVAERQRPGQADLWAVTAWARARWPSVPEKSDVRDSEDEAGPQSVPFLLPLRDDDDFSGTIPLAADSALAANEAPEHEGTQPQVPERGVENLRGIPATERPSGRPNSQDEELPTSDVTRPRGDRPFLSDQPAEDDLRERASPELIPPTTEARVCPSCGHAMVTTPGGRFVCTWAPGHPRPRISPVADQTSSAWGPLQ